MTTIYMARHGESTGNRDFTFQGCTDNPLSENGIKQCGLLAERMKDIKLDAIYCSPLSRAWDTAKMVGQYHDVQIVPYSSFMELGCGALEGMDMLDLHDTYPEHMHMWDHEPWAFVGPGMDFGAPEAFANIERALRCIVKNHPDQTVFIAAHGGVLRMFNSIAQGLDIKHIGEMGWGDNTCLSRAEFEPDFSGRLVMKNDISHVDKSLITSDFWLIKDELRAKRDKERQEGGA